MGQMHGSNGLSCRRFFQERIDRSLMQTGLEKVLKFRKGLIHIGSKLDLQPGSLFDRFLTETPQFFEVHQIQIFKGNEPVGFLYHKSLGNDVSVDLICLRFADVVFPYGRSRDRIEDTNVVALRNKVADQVVGIMSRRFKTDDDLFVVERFEGGNEICL